MVARELEAGTHRLAWNQTVTRTRWLAVKLGLTAAVAMVAVGLLSLAVSRWCRPLDAAVNGGVTGDPPFGLPRLSPAMFDARGLAPIGYTAFALALGVSAGIVIRRTVPAMAVTLAVFVAVQIAVPLLVRRHVAPAHATTTITADNLRGLNARVSPSGPIGPVRDLTVAIDKPGAWIIANQTLDPAGRVTRTVPGWVAYCVPAPEQVHAGPGVPGCFTRLARAGYRQRVTYQPAGRYWALQAYETAFFLVLAALLSGFSLWRLRRLS
jgi:hypothetical protein